MGAIRITRSISPASAVPSPPLLKLSCNKGRFRQKLHIWNSGARVHLLETTLFLVKASHAIHSNLRHALGDLRVRFGVRRVFTLENPSCGCETLQWANWADREKRCELAEKRCAVGHLELGGPSSRCRSAEKLCANSEFRYRKVATRDTQRSVDGDDPLH